MLYSFHSIEIEIIAMPVIFPDFVGKYLFLPVACAEDNTNAGTFGRTGEKTPLAVFAIYITKN